MNIQIPKNIVTDLSTPATQKEKNKIFKELSDILKFDITDNKKMEAMMSKNDDQKTK